MIFHTLIYRFPQTVPAQEQQQFFTEMRDLVLGTGLTEGFDLRPHLWLGADKGARGLTADWIVQFACKDLETLDRFSQLPAVFDFVTDWKARVNFEAAYANHERLDPFQSAA